MNIPQDKLEHAFIGVFVGYLHFVGWHSLAGIPAGWAFFVGIYGAFYIGWLKEAGDLWLHTGNADSWDAHATTMGGLLGASMGLFGEWLKNLN